MTALRACTRRLAVAGLASCLLAGSALAQAPRAASKPNVRTPVAAKRVQPPAGRAVVAVPVMPVAAAESTSLLTGLAEHEKQLQAIRQALLEATLAAPVRVQSTAWIDADGRLHEDAQYTSDARVRGVRVLSYLEDREPKVRVDTTVLPPGVRPGASDDPEICIAQQGRWRQALHLEVQAGQGLDERTGTGAQLLGQARQALLEAAGQSRRWASRARPYQPATAYERALLGREVDQADWLARLALQRTSAGLEAVFELRSTQSGAAPRQWRMPVAAAAPGAAAGTVPSAAALSPLVAAWVDTLDEQTACQPVSFTVMGSPGAWRLREGEPHGLRAGDRMLVVDRQHLAGRSLEARAAPSVALVQVAAITPAGASLRWLAGPRPPSAGDWVALPL